MYSDDPADLFSQLFDELPDRIFAEGQEAEAWLDDEAVAEIASEVEREVVGTGRLSQESSQRFLDVEQADRNRFAVLRGLDLAFQQADLVAGSYDNGGLAELTLRYLETGRLSTSEVQGAVLPKLAVPAQEHLIPESLADAFSAVVRAKPDTPIPVEQALLDDWPSRTVRESGLYVAALPAFDRDETLDVTRVEGPPPAYRLRLLDPVDLETWVQARLEALDASSAQIALLPELALNPALQRAWSEACRTTPPPAGSALQVIVIGSGAEHHDACRPHNRAVAINRITGEVLWMQDKLFRFQLEDAIVQRWSLNEALGAGPLEEWIDVGDQLTVAEAPGFRAVVAICEDLTQHHHVGRTAAEWGVTLALCPIFSQAIRRFRWEEQHAGWLHQAAGIQTIVCNSQWVGDAEDHFNDPVGDVLVVGHDRLLAEQLDKTQPVVVRFTEHAAVLLAI